MQNELGRITPLTGAAGLWRYTVTATGRSFDLAPPVIELDGAAVPLAATAWAPVGAPRALANGATEHAAEAPVAGQPGLFLHVAWRVAPDDPVVRFRYRVRSERPRRLTKTSGRDRLDYLAVSLADLPAVREVRFSEFREAVHSFCLSEVPLGAKEFEHGLTAMGPMLVAGDASHTLLVAYEHGSQVPDAFLHFRLAADRRVTLAAVKGNYWSGRALAPGQDFESIWFQFAAVAGDADALAAAYRAFVLHHQTENLASRRPYIFYNTWAYQERNKWWHGKAYLDSMHEARLLAEIDVAHQMGIDVYVIDTGWFEKTGDWRVNRQRFPDGLQTVRRRLEGYGMKLGLWFDPSAAVSSDMHARHRDCLVTRGGQAGAPHPIWETEPAQRMCLASRFADAFADELIRLSREVGVTYFKWDAIGQYGCDDPGHWHGDASTPAAERADCYAFELGRGMIRAVDRLCAACPEAIVDFDITEGGRFVGLGFLGAGKFFLINNGPYFRNFDLPYDWSTGTLMGHPGVWSNIFVHPGPARGWICREPLGFDKWVPSVLFLTHYLPDDPAASQYINLASLILGQNGIWGDLLTVSSEGVSRCGEVLGRYKQVRDDITAAPPVRRGPVGGNPELHEKLNPATGRGVVVAFASTGGVYEYVTERAASGPFWCSPGATCTPVAGGRVRLRFTFDSPGARIVFCGAK